MADTTMTDIKLTQDDFKETNNRTGIKYYIINENTVKQILENQNIVERLNIAISKYDGKMNEHNIVSILKEVLGYIK